MKEKAAFKNPDEFYFGMVHTKMKDGVHQVRQEESHTGDELKAFKREDAGYLSYKLATEKKKVARLRANLHDLSAASHNPQNKRTVFVDDAADVGAAATSTAAHVAANAEVLSRDHVPGASRPVAVKSSKAKQRSYLELEQRTRRRDKLERAVQKVATERALQSKGRRKKLKPRPGKAKQFKWRQERQR